MHERASDSYFLPFSFFFLLDRRRRPDVANEAWKESDAADIIRKRFYQAQPLSAPFHEIFECLLMVLAGKIEIPCFIVSDSLSLMVLKALFTFCSFEVPWATECPNSYNTDVSGWWVHFPHQFSPLPSSD